MSPESEFDETKGLAIPFEEEEIILSWANTRMRIFKNPDFNHIEWTDDNGQLKGIRAAQWLMDVLFEHEFPYQFDARVDEETFEWFVQMEMEELDNL